MGHARCYCRQYLHGQWDRGHALHRDGSHAAAGDVLLLARSGSSRRVVLAIVISFVALWRVFALRSVADLGHKVVNAFILGAAIPVMHYVGMAAATFHPGCSPALRAQSRDQHLRPGRRQRHVGHCPDAGIGLRNLDG